jgi:DNA end-binding protein Ku
VLRIREGVITLERLYFTDEIREPKEYKPGNLKVEKRELDMATELIDRFSGEWDPKKYKDTYREALMDVIKQKRKGKEIHVEREPEPEEPADLMEALRASLEASTRSKPAARKRSTSTRKRASARKSRAKTKR